MCDNQVYRYLCVVFKLNLNGLAERYSSSAYASAHTACIYHNHTVPLCTRCIQACNTTHACLHYKYTLHYAFLLECANVCGGVDAHQKRGMVL